VLRHWPGAETIYDARWIHQDPAEMAAAIASLASGGEAGGEDSEATWRLAGEAAHAQAAEKWALQQVCASWHRLLTADLEPSLPGPPLELLGSH
jgi:hypothetical protein